MRKLAAASVASIGALLHAVLGFAVLEERIEANPALGLARPLALTSRERMFDDAALRTLWDAASEASVPRGPGEKTAGVHVRLERPWGHPGAAVTSVYDRHTYAPEKRAALELWANHVVRPGGTVAPRPTAMVPAPAADTHIGEAKARALALCQKGDLHEAVLSICMDLSRHPDTANSHLAILSKVGLERAAAGSRAQVEDWMGGR